ncbi:sodium channel protein Nach-like [Spodoptera litura]|uniref:Sodium channel protein Nach-like n=1 Tax=Spodoptera litura TaxID=69820 RepID=A0A9J7ET44_SPOLT|nr:sodium channel protein Nach-like [Spodoptera litura]
MELKVYDCFFKAMLKGMVLNDTTSALHFFFTNPVFLKKKQETVMSIISLAYRLSRCFWVVNMISVLAMSFSITYFLYNRFEEMPTRITIENQFEPIENLPYPAITLCTPNQLTQSALEYFNSTLIEGNRTELETYLPLVLGLYEFISLTNQTENLLKSFQDLLEMNRFTISDLLSHVPQNCENFLKRCYLEGKQYNCSDLFKPILTTHGYCCSFNNVYMFNGKMNVKNRNFVNRNVRATGFTKTLLVVIDFQEEDAMNATILYGGATPVMYSDWSEFPSDDELFYHDNYGESFHTLSATYTYCSEEVKSLPLWR